MLLLDLFLFFNYVYQHESTCGYVHMCDGSQKGQRPGVRSMGARNVDACDPPDMGTRNTLESAGQAESAVNHSSA